MCDIDTVRQRRPDRWAAASNATVDSIYLGGGTPTVLDIGAAWNEYLSRSGKISRSAPDAEITVECAPGTLSARRARDLLRCGVNRVSLGVQSFVDQEAAAVGRLHKRKNRARESPGCARRELRTSMSI